jgi:hypothetical protein
MTETNVTVEDALIKGGPESAPHCRKPDGGPGAVPRQ